MSSVIFNSFKQRFLNGEVSANDTWTFRPVNTNFTANFGQDEFVIEQYRTLSDFYMHNESGMNASEFRGDVTSYTWFKPREIDENAKPMFITSGASSTSGNWAKFIQSDAYNAVKGNSSIHSYLASGGFYLIRTKDELDWFADRANTGNNRIIGVFADGVEGVIKNQIGENEDYPFQGILDGNGNKLENISIFCDNDDNGLVGVLGQDGLVKNFSITNTKGAVSLVCHKQITLNHIKNDGRDINAGILVGRNYGRIENINASKLGEFKFSGFVPQVYSVTNKSDDYDNFGTVRKKYDDGGKNFYYLNSFCINSPGNICPYVGYFAEGLFAQSGRGRNASGDIQAIEYAPAYQAKFNPGILKTDFDLNGDVNGIEDFAFYVKDDEAIANTDSRYYLGADGTNVIALCGYDMTVGGSNRRVMLEINGTAYDKRADTSERRIFIHGGKLKFRSQINVLNTLPNSDYNDMYSQVPAMFIDTIGGNYIRTAVHYDNGTNGLGYAYTESDFEIGPDDIRAFLYDGTEVKVNSVDVADFFITPLNNDTSTAIISTIVWTPKFAAGTVIASFTHTNKDGSTTKYTASWGEAGSDIFIDVLNALSVQASLIQFDVTPPTDEDDYVRSEAQLALCKKIVDDLKREDSEFVTWTCEQKTDGWERWVVVDEGNKCSVKNYLSNSPSWKTLYAAGLLTVKDYDIRISNNLKSQGSINITVPDLYHFQYRPVVHSAPELQQQTNVSTSDFVASISWNPGTLYGLVGERLFYLSGTDMEKARSAADPTYISPYGNSSLSALDFYVKSAAPAYIHAAQYYGLDVNGLWTTNSVRMDPKDMHDDEQTWSGSLTAEGEKWFHTINFNWNIMQQMFEVDGGEWFDSMRKYATIDDQLDPVRTDDINAADEIAEDCDIPHILLNRPMKMNTMARAGYYISPIAGANYGTISNVVVSSNRQNAGNFVGFIGSIAGKQERGTVENVSVYANDRFTYWEGVSAEPNSANLAESAYSAAMQDYQTYLRNYNYAVTYKQTPIIPSTCTEGIADLAANPDDNSAAYKYYPRGIVTDGYVLRILNGDIRYAGGTGQSAVNKMLNDKHVSAYTPATYTNNPYYKLDLDMYKHAALFTAFESAWYSNNENTAVLKYDDTITYNLRPIFNAGGLFGKVVPTYNANYSGTTCKDVNVVYNVEQTVSTSDAEVQLYTEDIHNTYGAIAGLMEIQTSQVGASNSGDKNTLKLKNVNASGASTRDGTLAVIGFASYQPIENNSIASVHTSPRQKENYWYAQTTDTTYALDLPIAVDQGSKNAAETMQWSINTYNFAPTNQSNAAFIDMNPYSYEGDWEDTGDTDVRGFAGKRLNYAGLSAYMQHVIDTVVKTDNVNTNNTACLVNANPGALDIYSAGNLYTVNAALGSNTIFAPVLPMVGSAGTNAVQETLLNGNTTRIYGVVAVPMSGNISNATQVPVDISKLSDSEIFAKNVADDIYFDYSYSSTVAKNQSLNFTKNVYFNTVYTYGMPESAQTDINTRMGYTFSDELSHEGDGFQYEQNYLHLGESVSPAYIRYRLSQAETFTTSGVAGISGQPQFGGFLVTDSQDRNVMFIDNTAGAQIGGGSYNLKTEHVASGAFNGGMLLEVK